MAAGPQTVPDNTMPQQLIYTSSPRGLVVGRTGYCTVACTQGMRDALQTKLEQLSYFDHGSSAAGHHSEVCAYRIIDIRGTRFYCLSRIVDSGLDFTKRTNFTAHHLVFSASEVANMPSPPVLFLEWNGWLGSWSGDPEWLKDENWGNLFSLVSRKFIPCEAWQALTGDAQNAAYWLDPRAEALVADGFDHAKTLILIGESLALHEARPGGVNPWQVPFTTGLQEGDDSAEFRCRLVYSGTSAHARLVARGAVLVGLKSAKAKGVDQGTAACARDGLRILRHPESQSTYLNEQLLLSVEAVAGSALSYQWYLCTPEGKALQEIPGETAANLKYNRLKVGYNHFCVVVGSGGGSLQSLVAKITVRAAPRGASGSLLPSTSVPEVSRDPAVATRIKPRRSLENLISVDEGDEPIPEKPNREWLKWGAILFLVAILMGAIGFVLIREFQKGAGGQKPVPKPVEVNASLESTKHSQSEPISMGMTNSGAGVSENAPVSQVLTAKIVSRNVKVCFIPIAAAVAPKSTQVKLEDSKHPATSKGNPKGQTNHPSTVKSPQMNGPKEKHVELLKAKIGKLPLSPGQTVYSKCVGLLRSDVCEVKQVSNDFVFDHSGWKVSVKADTTNAFTIKELSASANGYGGPILVVFGTNSEPAQTPMVEVVLWPTAERFLQKASYEEGGRINFGLNGAFKNLFDDLRDAGGYSIRVNLKYGEEKRPAWSYQGTTSTTSNVFPELAEKFRRWNTNRSSITNLISLRDRAAKKTGTIPPAGGCLEEFSQICELLLQGRLVGTSRSYDFKGSGSREIARFLEDLDRERKIEEPEKENIRQEIRMVDLAGLEAFIKEEGGDAAIPSLAQAKDRLEYYVTKTGGPVLDHFTGTITLKDGESGPEIMLMAFKF